MKELIERSYKAIRDRGLIDENTNKYHFLLKMDDELSEVFDAKSFDEFIHETTDLMTVCTMALTHFGFDPIKEFKKVVEKNEKRAAQKQS
jgi:hypothetical protein